MIKQLIRRIGDVYHEMLDRVQERQALEFQALTAHITALARFPKQPALAAGDLSQAAELLRAERLRQDWDLQDYLEAVGMCRSTLNRIENQRCKVTTGTLEHLAAALGKKLIVALVELDKEDEPSSAVNHETTS